jgi:hypothetical protein
VIFGPLSLGKIPEKYYIWGCLFQGFREIPEDLRFEGKMVMYFTRK